MKLNKMIQGVSQNGEMFWGMFQPNITEKTIYIYISMSLSIKLATIQGFTAL